MKKKDRGFMTEPMEWEREKGVGNMKYPANYVVVEQEELLAVTGGNALDIFDQLTGSMFQNQFLNSVRATVWNCLQQKSLRPVVDWGKDFWHMSLLGKVTFLYGGFRVGQTTVNYWKKE